MVINMNRSSVEIQCSLIEKLIVLDMTLGVALPFEDGVGEVGVLLLQHLELPLYLLSCLGDLGCNEAEVTTVPLEQLHQSTNLCLGPVGWNCLLGGSLSNLLLLLAHPILQGNLINKGLNG